MSAPWAVKVGTSRRPLGRQVERGDNLHPNCFCKPQGIPPVIGHEVMVLNISGYKPSFIPTPEDVPGGDLSLNKDCVSVVNQDLSLGARLACIVGEELPGL